MRENQTESKSSDNNNKKNIKDPLDNIVDFKYEILSEDFTNFDLSFKVIVIGDSGVGKSCLTNSAVKNTFEESYNATVGFEFFTFNVRMFDKVIKLQIWDTCGQELYRSLITNFYRNSSLAIIVYAVNSRESFEDLEMWLRELRTHSNPDAKVFLIGNKIDLEDERQVTTEEGEAFSKGNKFDIFMESSAKTGLNAQNIFLLAAKKLYDNYTDYHSIHEREDSDINSNYFENDNSNKKLNYNKNKSEKSGCC